MLKFILICIVAYSGYHVWSNYPIKHGPGVIAQNPPKINNTVFKDDFSFKKARLFPLKEISGEVRILENKKYYFDSNSEISPLDVLVGWSEMSDEKNIDHVNASLDDRYLKLKYSRPPLPLKTIMDQIALWHLVPSTKEMEKKLKNVRRGSVIRLEGQIVNINKPNGHRWVSLIKKNDSEDLDRKIIWITSLNIY